MLSQIQTETPPEDLAALAETHYFAANPPPKDLEKHVALARDFINFHSAAGRRLVLVTSGGTTVPLGIKKFRIWRCGLLLLTPAQRNRRFGSLTTSLLEPAGL